MLDPERGLVGRGVAPATRTPRRRRRGRRPTRTRGSPRRSPLVPEACADAGVDAGGDRGRRRRRLRAVRACCSTRTTRRCGPALLYNDGRADREIDEVRERRSAPSAVLARTGRRRHAAVRRARSCAGWRATSPTSCAGRGAWRARTTGSPAGSRACALSERNWALESGLYDLEAGRLRRRPAGGRGLGSRAPRADPRPRRRRRRRDGRRPPRRRACAPARRSSPASPTTSPRPSAPASRRTATCWSSSAARSTCSPSPTGLLVDERLYLDAHPAPGLWLPNGCMASGGSAIRWFQRELAGGTPLAELDREAAATPGRRRRARRSCPTCWARRRRSTTRWRAAPSSGSGSATRAGTCSARCWRASGTACATTWRCWPSTASARRARGSPTAAPRRALWKQAVADVTGLELEPLADHPGSALGSAFAAGVGHGRVRRVERDRALPGGRRPVVRPDPATRAVHDARHAVYRDLYAPLRAVLPRAARRRVGFARDARPRRTARRPHGRRDRAPARASAPPSPASSRGAARTSWRPTWTATPPPRVAARVRRPGPAARRDRRRGLRRDRPRRRRRARRHRRLVRERRHLLHGAVHGDQRGGATTPTSRSTSRASFLCGQAAARVMAPRGAAARSSTPRRWPASAARRRTSRTTSRRSSASSG